jgi:cytidylate kinase
VEEHGGGVVEGRDIGTVVLPDADLKVFLTASDEERARRRHQEVTELAVEQVASDLARRDHLDSTRATSPLRAAEDAVVVDTTTLAVDAIVEDLLSRLKEGGR